MRQTGQRSESGKFNFITVVVLLAIASAIYSGVKFIPVYVEHSQATRLVKRAANQWLNVEPDLDKVRDDLQRNLDQADVATFTADDVNFAEISGTEVEAWVDYQVVIRHPWKKLTRINFKIQYTAKRTFDGRDE